jgi:hypothetical protein
VRKVKDQVTGAGFVLAGGFVDEVLKGLAIEYAGEVQNSDWMWVLNLGDGDFQHRA